MSLIPKKSDSRNVFVSNTDNVYDKNFNLFQDEINKSLLSNNIDESSPFKVVEQLPTSPSESDKNKLHLVKDDSVDENNSNNIFNEFIYVNGKWELLGQITLNVDLSNYPTFNDIATNEKDGLLSKELFPILNSLHLVGFSAITRIIQTNDNVGLQYGIITSDGGILKNTVTTIGGATPRYAGVMSVSDKLKLDSLPNIWKGTQAEYDEIDTKDSNTLYFIIEE